MINSSDLQTQKQEVESVEGIERTRATRVFLPKVDILSDDDAIVIFVDLPGVNEQNIDITVEKRVLTINGYVETSLPEGYELAYGEYGIGDFQRTFTLPEEIDSDGIKAKISQGVLSLTLPKAPEARAKRIAVTAS